MVDEGIFVLPADAADQDPLFDLSGEFELVFSTQSVQNDLFGLAALEGTFVDQLVPLIFLVRIVEAHDRFFVVEPDDLEVILLVRAHDIHLFGNDQIQIAGDVEQAVAPPFEFPDDLLSAERKGGGRQLADAILDQFVGERSLHFLRFPFPIGPFRFVEKAVVEMAAVVVYPLHFGDVFFVHAQLPQEGDGLPQDARHYPIVFAEYLITVARHRAKGFPFAVLELTPAPLIVVAVPIA